MAAPAENPFPIVGVGASAGGLGALTQLLAALPPRPGLALVVIQHLDPTHASHLPDLLRPHTAVQGQYSVGVILSGTGSDGTLGICEIKAAGGLTFAQDDYSAQHIGMPQSAIASGAVDLVLPPNDIAARLAEVRHHPYLAE